MPALLELPDLLQLDPVTETERIDALRSLNLLDTPAEDRFDRITRLAADFFKIPVVYVALIDGTRQWFKSRQGVCLAQTSRSDSFCQYTIQMDGPFVIPDTYLDELGKNHPMVVNEPHVRFYAGMPLRGPGGKKVGTFCLVDFTPRKFGEQDVAQLVAFASLVEREINLSQIIQTQSELLATREELVQTQQKLDHELSDAARYVEMMLPAPFSGEESVDWKFQPSHHLGGDGLGFRRINDDLLAVYVLDVTGHGLGSALLAVTALELLRNPAAQLDMSQPSAVIDRLNRSFPMKNHGGKFFSAWYGVYSRSARTITYANAGHPPPFIRRPGAHSHELEEAGVAGMALGILPEAHVPVTTVSFPAGSELYLFTDGLYELLESDGGRGSHDEFSTWLTAQVKNGKPVWDTMLHWLDRARDKRLIDDNVTMMRFCTRA